MWYASASSGTRVRLWRARRRCPSRAAGTASEFDVWAFTISWEMDYFHVVDLLRQSGIAAAGF